MSAPMIRTLPALRAYLAAHGAVEGYHYVVGGLGSGEVSGIAYQEGQWLTYYSERGARADETEWPDEAAACAALLPEAEAAARRTGDWRD